MLTYTGPIFRLLFAADENAWSLVLTLSEIVFYGFKLALSNNVNVVTIYSSYLVNEVELLLTKRISCVEG